MITNNSPLSFAALIGNHRVKIVDGYVTGFRYHLPSPSVVWFDNCYKPIYTEPYSITIDLSVVAKDMIFELYDPFAPYPIGSKIVDECTVDELLFAIQHKLGIIKGGDIGIHESKEIG
jgi:hypothetical protein